jgi:AraC family transcriptional regulator of adaptative response / DNA-3-methyladenine glycosylase II
VRMRALHAPDVLLSSDLVIKRELAARRISDTTGWAPWRSYATMHLWRAWTG